MTFEVLTVTRSQPAPIESEEEHDELIRRVASSVTFEKSPRLRAFFLHVCRCAIEKKAEEATEQQIGIYVYGRSPGYNPNDDNIVRSQARVLRMKLEHHFANEGKDEPVIITIPKGQYLPVFDKRHTEPAKPIPISELQPRIPGQERKPDPSRLLLIGLIGALAFAVICLAYLLFESKRSKAPAATTPAAPLVQSLAQGEAAPQPSSQRIALAADPGEIRIVAGHSGSAYVDVWGHRWDTDRYYEGGVPRPGPQRFFPPVADEGLYRTIREAASASGMVPQTERGFRYDIPLPPGVYELKLYFADPLRQPDVEQKEDEQNSGNFEIAMNGRPILKDFDPIADAGSAAVDARVFKDVRPAADGKLHLDFHTNWGRPAFVNALELIPGTPGKMRPIRISAHQSDFIDADGTRWSGDKNFIDGRTGFYDNSETGPRIPALYSGERLGNFSYAIPVAPGSYTVRLHFLESFFSPLIPDAYCHGVGCRVFDVTCNGTMLLHDFDIVQAAGGPFRPVVREFHALHPNGQGKLLLSFSPRVNYAEVRAIEIIDEGK